MDNENTENLDSQIEETVVESTETTPEVDVEALKQTNKELFERAKKAEQALKEAKKAEKVEKPTEQNSLSTKDVLYLASAGIHQDDLDEVLDWAKFKGISVNEAHKQLKTTLDIRAEERRSAQVSSTKSARNVSKATDETIVEQASQGKLPDSASDIEKLAEARMNLKLKK